MPIAADIVAVWTARLTREAEGLNLADADDRSASDMLPAGGAGRVARALTGTRLSPRDRCDSLAPLVGFDARRDLLGVSEV